MGEAPQIDDTARSDGSAMMALATELFPICRSITGAGLRKSLAILQRHMPIAIEHVPSGQQVLDWTVPPEWNIRSAYIARLDGTRVVDFADNNLHIVQYSHPLDTVIARPDLLARVHSLPDRPDWIPYRTSYYKADWGFCMSDRARSAMTDAYYRVVIDADLAPGHLSYGELVIPGQTERSVLLSCHVCHPSLANDNLSGIAVATRLADHIARMRPRYTYRFVFIPGTIGSLTWLARNEHVVSTIQHGLVLSCLGDRGPMTYKQTRRGNASIDRIVEHVLRHALPGHRIRSFTPYGYDERQYCSPGFNLPVGCLMRTPNGEYDEYHTSADNLSLLDPHSLVESLGVLKRIIAIIEGDALLVSRCQKGEPQLGRRGLYEAIGGRSIQPGDQKAILWVLNLADGNHSLFDIAERSGLSFEAVATAAAALREASLLEPAQEAD